MDLFQGFMYRKVRGPALLGLLDIRSSMETQLNDYLIGKLQVKYYISINNL